VIALFISKLEALFQKWSEEEWFPEADAETAQKITHGFNELLTYVSKKHPEFDRDSFYSPEMLQFLHQYN